MRPADTSLASLERRSRTLYVLTPNEDGQIVIPETCPRCHGAVGRRDDGALFPHRRFANGCDRTGHPGRDCSCPSLAHTLVPCEGGA